MHLRREGRVLIAGLFPLPIKGLLETQVWLYLFLFLAGNREYFYDLFQYALHVCPSVLQGGPPGLLMQLTGGKQVYRTWVQFCHREPLVKRLNSSYFSRFWKCAQGPTHVENSREFWHNPL